MFLYICFKQLLNRMYTCRSIDDFWEFSQQCCNQSSGENENNGFCFKSETIYATETDKLYASCIEYRIAKYTFSNLKYHKIIYEMFDWHFYNF